MNIEKPLPNNSVKNLINVFAETIQMNIHMSNFEVKRICGIGSNGCVFLVKNKENQRFYALKCVNLSYYLARRFELDISKIHSEIYDNFDILTGQIMHSEYQITDHYQEIADNFESVAEKNSFFREFEALKHLPHTSSTVYLLDYGYFQIQSFGKKTFYYKVPYVVMPLMQGKPLTCYIEMSISPFQRLKNVLSWTEDVIEIVSLIHDCGVIHRDLYSNNFLFDPDTGNISLIDFGASLTLDHRELDTPGERRGARRFMSPEQFRNPNQVDFRSDYFFIGALMFYGLTQQTPFKRSRDALTFPRCFDGTYRNKIPLSKSGAEILGIFIDTLLEYDPEKRFQTMEDLKVVFSYVRTVLEKEPQKHE